MPNAASLPRLSTFLKTAGPGLVVMLADTDVGSLITAAQSGARWGYSLLLLQILLVPILYIVQELTVRLGTATGRGHGELIRAHYGPVWAWVSYTGLVIAGVGAIVTEFSGIAGIGDLFGVPRIASLGLPVALLLGLVFTGGYRRVEVVAIAVGLFELVFIGLAVAARPNPGDIVASFAHIPLGDSSYRVLIAANIGAVIMPWMIFYQQSAIVDKGLGWDHARNARLDTFVGAVVSQCVMGAILIAAAATIGQAGQGTKNGLETVGDLAGAFTPALGPWLGQVVFGVGIVAAAFVALNVVALALAWGFGDVTGRPHSLEQSPREAPVFYGAFALVVVAGAVAVELVTNLVALNIAVEVMNALLLPLALGLLILLATRALPEDRRVRGAYKWVVYGVSGLTVAFAMVGVLDGVGLL
ncbi:NRAMP family metal ion transporter [Methylobacterium sp. GXS13]|uniref:NRAMP family divalent metal transporter n=1 Tax=Methylobacterium sp. GXS13 TaxID=1730094 RepID=UPI00071BE8F7|nr:divalent metal cation transporter [Methylobacterium sp. GXS13]KST58519.1 NRAMP family metal ion transporter [Methylobacterium sp. GXS13]